MKSILFTNNEIRVLRRAVAEAGSIDNNFRDHILEKLEYYIK